MKTYVITLSQNFPAMHKQAGKPTNFKEKFLRGENCANKYNKAKIKQRLTPQNDI